MANKIVGYVMGISMHLSHDGLKEVALTQRPKIDLEKLNPGEFVLFSNNAFTAVKIFGSGNTFIYHRAKANRTLNPRALMHAVECFDGVEFAYPQALAKAIEEQLSPEMRAWLKKQREAKKEI